MEKNFKNELARVCIVLSSYNGSKYIEEQLESIRKQKMINIYCYIRDDGSTDDTVSIIKKYIKKNNNFKLIEGKNIGVNRSFTELLSIVPDDFEYYAFSDQDDIWLPDKLIKAVEKLSNVKKEQPALYCSNLTAIYENGIQEKVWKDTINRRRENLLIENWAWGCTEVFNNSARKLWLQYPCKKTSMHDYWLHLLCAYVGEVIYDKNSYILYRQHESNVVGVRKNKFQHFISYLKNFQSNKEHPREYDAKYLLKIDNSFTDKELKEIRKVAYYNNSILKKIALLLDFRLHMSTLTSDIAYRIRIMRGSV